MQKPTDRRMITCVAVCGLDPKLTVSTYIEQKRITSLEFVKDILTSSEKQRYVEISSGCFLKVVFNEVGKLPVSDLEVINLDIVDSHVKLGREDWLPVQFSNCEDRQSNDVYKEKSVNIKQLLDDKKNPGQALVLGYHCEQGAETAITDIAILKAQKGRGQEKFVFNVPQGYKMLNHTFSYKGKSKYLIYRRASNKLELDYAPILMESYPSKHSDRISLQLLPMFCFPQGVHLSQEMRGFITFSFILSSASRFYCSCMVIKELLPLVLKKKLGLLNQKVYCQKAICIVSEYSYPEQFCQILQHLYRISMSKNDVPLYVVVQQLVSKLSLVEENQLGKVAISYPYGGCSVVFYTNPHYPVVSEKSIYTLCKFLSAPHIILLYQALLLQKHIFLVSQSKTVIGLVVEALLGILFPFKWEHVLIPILPEALEQYSNAIVPFIIGIPPSLTDLEKDDCIYVNLDHNQFINSEQMPPLPDKLQKQLSKRLQNYQYYVEAEVSEYLENPQNTYIFQMRAIDYPEFDPYDVRDAFLEFNASLMKNFNKFWNKGKRQALYRDANQPLKDISQLFSVDDFLSDINMTKIGSFGCKFTETSIFNHFIERKCRFPEDPHLKFFDECLQKKKKKKDIRCIVEVKPQELRATPSPVWQSNKDRTFRYQSFPSIVSQEGQLDLEMIEMELIVQQEQRTEKSSLLSTLVEKHSVYKGLFQAIGSDFPCTLGKLNLKSQIQTLAGELLTTQNLNEFVNQINQMSDIRMAKTSQVGSLQSKLFDVHKDRKETRALEIIDVKLYKQSKQLKDLALYFDSLSTEGDQVSFNDLLSRPVTPKQGTLVVQTLLGDVKSISCSNKTIIFDNRRHSLSAVKGLINIVVHNTSTKQLLNKIISRQPRRFHELVIDLIQHDQFVWIFDHFVQFRSTFK